MFSLKRLSVVFGLEVQHLLFLGDHSCIHQFYLSTAAVYYRIGILYELFIPFYILIKKEE